MIFLLNKLFFFVRSLVRSSSSGANLDYVLGVYSYVLACLRAGERGIRKERAVVVRRRTGSLERDERVYFLAGFFAAGFLAAGFLAAGFFAVGFLAAGFLAAGFLAATILMSFEVF